MNRLRNYASSFPDLPRELWLLMGAHALSNLGMGLVYPFNAIYLYEVRGFSLAAVGFVLGTIAVGGLVVSFVGGALADRAGPRRVMAVGTVVQSTGYVALALAPSVPAALAAAAWIGVGSGLFSPALMPLLARLSTEDNRPTVFSLQYMGTQAGIGGGAALGGLLLAVTASSPAAFLALYLANAASYLVYGAIVLFGLPASADGAQAEARETPGGGKDSATAGGYLSIVRNTTFLGIFGLHLLIALFGFAQLDSSVPLYANETLSVPAGAIGLMFAVNTLVAVVAQLPVTKAVESWRRTRVLAALGVLWAGSWLIVGLAGLGTGWSAAALLVAFFAVFALGECLFSPAFWPLVTGTVPSASLGRYNVFLNFSWYGGLTLGPAFGAWIVGSFLGGSLWVVFGLASALIVPWALLLERQPRGRSRSPDCFCTAVSGQANLSV